MQWFNKKVKYTPEIVTIKRGNPVDGCIVSEGILDVTIELTDGKTVRAEKRLCEFLS